MTRNANACAGFRAGTSGCQACKPALEAGEQQSQGRGGERSQRDGDAGIKHHIADLIIHADDPFPKRALRRVSLVDVYQ